MSYRLSKLAKRDLKEIGQYTRERWGIEQAAKYTDDLQAACEILGHRPLIGRTADSLHPGTRRMESGSHVIFFVEEPQGILVARILHKSMLPEEHGL